MNRFFVKHEFMLMCKSKKNFMFIVFLTALLLSYCFVILPNKQTVDSFDAKEMKDSLEDVAVLQESREAKGATGIILMVGMSVYAMDSHSYKVHRSMLNAYENEEFTRFLRLRMLDLDPYAFLQNESLFPNSPFPGKDRQHLFDQTTLRYESYLTGSLPISYEMIEQKTALQTVQNLLLGPMTYLFIFCAIYFSSDVLIRDRRNRTILQGMPLSWYRLINLKTLTAFLYTILVLSALVLAGMTILTIRNGFGYWAIQMPTTIPGEAFGTIEYRMIAIGKFIAMTMLGIFILVYLFTRLNMALSLLLKNEWLVLMISSLLLFSERIYFSRTLRESFGIEISYFPQTYFEFGKVITGDKNFLVNLETITYSKGLVLFFVAILMTELVLFIISRIVNKQRFYQIN